MANSNSGKDDLTFQGGGTSLFGKKKTAPAPAAKAPVKAAPKKATPKVPAKKVPVPADKPIRGALDNPSKNYFAPPKASMSPNTPDKVKDDVVSTSLSPTVLKDPIFPKAISGNYPDQASKPSTTGGPIKGAIYRAKINDARARIK